MKPFVTALKLFAVTAILTGLIYPLLITAIAQSVFNKEANGSLIVKNGQIKGSELISQKFDRDKYFWSRPSAVDYNGLSSGGSNLSATSKQLKDQIASREATLLKADPSKQANEIPSDLLYASGSGLDPHISKAAAVFQVDRILKARGLDISKKSDMLELINKFTDGRDLKVFGEPRVNVLKLNIALDERFKNK